MPIVEDNTNQNEHHHQETKKTKEFLAKERQRWRLLFVLFIILVGLVIATTVIAIVNPRDDNNDDEPLSSRDGILVDCAPMWRRNVEKMKGGSQFCINRGCVWTPQKDIGAPWCVYPQGSGYYQDLTIKENTTNRIQGTLTGYDDKDVTLTYGIPSLFNNITVDVQYQTDNRLRVRLVPNDVSRWEIPNSILNIEATNDANSDASTSLVNVEFRENPFGIVVTRKDSGTVVFNSSHPGTVLSKHFLQLTTSLPSGHLYGFGEHRHLNLHHDLEWKEWAMFTRDAGPNSDYNLYGQHPVYLNIETDGKANMVLLKNSNAMDVLLQPEPFPAVTFRTISGVLDFYIYVGDSPADVTAHYIKSIGLPAFPPYWSLGYHLCRWGYANITDMQSVVDRTIDAGIPYDGQWADIDTFYKEYTFTYDPRLWKGFPSLVNDLKKKHRHFVTIVDPGVGANQSIVDEIRTLDPDAFKDYDMYESGVGSQVFILNRTGDGPFFGEVWPGVTVYPDFTNPKTQAWWTKQIRYYIEDIGIKVDALWIDMNEPTNFVPSNEMGCEENDINYPKVWCPDIIGRGDSCLMFEKTLCMDSQQHLGIHRDVHSLYGHTMAMMTYSALDNLGVASYKNKRPWTMTRSSFVGTGHYATKWQGDNKATWEDMHYSIISILEFGFFGFPMNGADICGFWGEPSFELCVRWHQLGAFYPFARNHNGRGDPPQIYKHQDPASFGQDFVDLVKPVLLTRYKLLPYLYTCLYLAHRDGRMMMQPLFYQFPKDANTLTIDTQFMLGDALLISPILQEGAVSVEAYFPEGRWFDYLTGDETRSDDGRSLELATPLDKFNLHLRGGHIIPWQEPEVTTYQSRKNQLGLIVVLDHTGKANGQMFWDDGESKLEDDNFNMIKFTMHEAGKLTIESEGTGDNLKFQTIELYGLNRMPAKVKVGGKDWTSDNIEFVNNGIVRITELEIKMTTKMTTIVWSLY